MSKKRQRKMELSEQWLPQDLDLNPEQRAEHLDPWLGEILFELQELMHERGQKYGPTNIAEWGDLGVVVRLSDKMARLRTLYQTGAGAEALDESIEDTLMDLANYAIIALAWRRGLWPGSSE